MRSKFSKSIIYSSFCLLILGILILGVCGDQMVQAYSIKDEQLQDQETTQPEPTLTSTFTPTSTSTMTPTPTPGNYLRPIIIVQDYSYGSDGVRAGESFKLNLKLHNSGQVTARNILIVFEAGDLVPLETGGVKAISQLAPGESGQVQQPLMVLSSLSGGNNATMPVRVSYVDEHSVKYEEIFNLSFVLKSPVYYPVLPTATPEKGGNPQLIITAYQIDQSPLESGKIFNLELEVINMGMQSAQDITMILGGGFVDYSGSGTTPSGITGAEADFASFAPYNTSNLRFLGDLPPKEILTIVCPMIVNTTTKPGVHPLKISFVYSGEEEIEKYLDDQIITILVRRIPRVDISFYRDPGYLQVGISGILPIQVLNIDNDNLQVISLEILSEAEVSPQVVQVGSIESGGYFTQDFNIVPDLPGDVEVTLLLTYIDDFKEEQKVEKSFILQVEPQPEPQVEMTPSDSSQNNQTDIQDSRDTNFLAIIWRFFLGLLGLDSGA